jgi:hypothetical protein
MWHGTILPAPSDTDFPPPLVPVAVGAHPGKVDVAECDMGGGLRTPLIKAGPQYYLRTLPSKQTVLRLQHCARQCGFLVERRNRRVRG